MTLEPFIAIQYCYEYLIGQISIGLLLYSHLPTAFLAIAFGVFLFINHRKLPGATFFLLTAAFASWCVLDLVSWFAFLGSGTMMFTWSLADFVALIFFFFSYYFFYSFSFNRDLPIWQKIAAVLLLLPTAVWTFLGLNLTSYDASTCEALESETLALYPYVVQAIFLIGIAIQAVRAHQLTEDKRMRREIVLVCIGMLAFLGFFFLSTLGVNVLINYFDVVDFAYNFEIYGLFGMPVLLAYLGYVIVRYKAFDLRVFGAQALVLALVALIGSEFAFVSSLTNQILVGITLVLTAFIGIILIRSVRKEIEQRKHIEELAKELQTANDRQVTLIHFITHQIKGFLTKSRNIFASMTEGDFGELPETAITMAKAGFESDTAGVNTVQEILNASNIKSGKVTYAMAPFDLKQLIDEIATGLRPNAEKKSLAFNVDTGSTPITVTGDRAQLVNVYKNLIDNSIKYTPSGSVSVSLMETPGKAVFKIEDTGVGITPEDMAHLFTEGGHGKESQKINTESTGFGLYIVKNIIDAHKGKVWAESEGTGKGSRFFVELPA